MSFSKNMFQKLLTRSARFNLYNVYANCNRNISELAKNEVGKVKEVADETDADIDAALRIEASLFENSTLRRKPVATKDLSFTNKRQTQNSKITHAASAVRRNAPLQKENVIIEDPDLGLRFARLGAKDSQLNTLMTTVRSRKRRDKDGQIILEGRRLIRDGLECNLRMEALIFSQADELHQIKDEVAQAQLTQNTKIYKVPQHFLKMWSTLTTPPGLLGIFDRPSDNVDIGKMSSHSTAVPISVVCDNIREPNNLGSIIRACAAIPCMQVIVTRGCCDPWDSKSLRGGCGAHFRLPIRDNVDWETLPLLIPPESIENCRVFLAESNLNKFQDRVAPIDYMDLDGIGAHNIVIIGGESHGLSVDAYKFLDLVGSRGSCLHIPLADGIDSLNVVSALTLILFELRRKYSQNIET